MLRKIFTIILVICLSISILGNIGQRKTIDKLDNKIVTLTNEKEKELSQYKKEKNKLTKEKQELEEKGIEIEIFKADVSKRQEAKKLIEFALEKFKQIDVLVNNAGISQIKLFTEITDEDWARMINTNLNSVFYCTQEALPNMINNKSGCIINISSIWGITGASCEVHYSVSKAAIDGLTKSLAKELGPSNIRVNSVAPGFIDTDINKNISEQARKEFIEQIPMEKIGQTEDISKCVEWLIEDNYTTGQVISINGGIVI